MIFSQGDGNLYSLFIFYMPIKQIQISQETNITLVALWSVGFIWFVICRVVAMVGGANLIGFPI